MINHFTDPFRAEGRGKLDLQLVLPLHKMEQSRVKGEYQFTRNQLQPDPAMPVLTEASGRVEFTESQLGVRNGTARIFGDPVSVSGAAGPTAASSQRPGQPEHAGPAPGAGSALARSSVGYGGLEGQHCRDATGWCRVRA
jgi:hypothetical protein